MRPGSRPRCGAGRSPPRSAGGAAVGAAAAVLVGLPTLRLHGLYFAIATLAFAEMVRLAVRAVPLSGRDRRRARSARTAPTASAASATSSRTTSSPLQFLAADLRAAGRRARSASCCSSARASASRFRMIGAGRDACRAQRHRGRAPQGARRRSRRRARRPRRRALRASDHLSSSRASSTSCSACTASPTG